jgi:hypothetical protein
MHAVFLVWDILRMRQKQRLEEQRVTNPLALEAIKMRNDKAFGGYAMLLWQTYLKRERVPWLQGEYNATAPYPVLISDARYQEITNSLSMSATTPGGILILYIRNSKSYILFY